MLKSWLLRLHRWTTLVFALPLAIVILTGLVLSVEPIAQDLGSRQSPVNSERLLGLLSQHDPAGKARSIAVRAYENRLNLSGVGPEGSLDLDLTTGQPVDDSERTLLSDVFLASRLLHEHFILDQRWVVTASTIAMLVLIALGVLMGWPRLRHSISGWHQGMAWIGLPLLVLSPLTGLAIVLGITFQPAAPRVRAEPVPVRQAVERLAEKTDISGLIWMRQRGGRLLARVNEQGQFRVYAISADGAALQSQNWPRALHEGNFAGAWSGVMVLVTSIGFIGLLMTGLWIYTRRALRKRNPRPRPQPSTA
jgi:uncharacterized iron-regulated membrane protein